MNEEFWHQKWKSKEIGFHMSKPNPLLVKHFHALRLQPDSRIFLPLCGKTLDIGWLLSIGHRVVGAELSETAIKELFGELGIEPEVIELDSLKRYSGSRIDIFVGDIFNLSEANLGPVDAIYDRAALVALPKDMRRRYTEHLMQITNRSAQLLICFEYDQELMSGPPFAVDEYEVNRHYGDTYRLSSIDRSEVVGGLKGICSATENVWLLLHDGDSGD